MMLFDIQRNSWVDGPGIRTTVFFKGCNLRCKWCHNPESQRFEKQMLFYADRCIGCGKCREKCHNGLGSDVVNCVFCGQCEKYCPQNARKICGKEYSVDEVMTIICKDKRFYEKSGGGVTFSGGECMLQLDALCELLAACKEKEIPTAVDTAGAVPFASFQRILNMTDLYLYDIKAFTPTLHKALTGCDNALILSNYRKLCQAGAKIIVRIPVIGGANDSLEEMAQIAGFLKDYPPEKVELLSYHGMGDNKYAALNQQVPPYYSVASKEPERYAAIQNLFASLPG